MSLRDELMRVRESHGSLTPEAVVSAARDEDSPLHSRFEWDDTLAAEKYRRVQAADLIRKVRVSYVEGEERREVRAFIAVRGDDTPSSVYEPTEEVLADPFTAKLLFQELKREIKVLQSKYGHLEGFRAVLTSAADAA